VSLSRASANVHVDSTDLDDDKPLADIRGALHLQQGALHLQQLYEEATDKVHLLTHHSADSPNM
jgi:hypothetical protein